MFSVQARTVASITLRATMGRKRVFLFALPPLILLLITAALKLAHPPGTAWPSHILGDFGFVVILPLTALIIGTSVLGAEIDDGSVVHLLATPVPRSTVIISKFAVAAVLTMAFVAVPELVAGLIATGGATKLAVGLFVGALAGSVIYNAVFVMISVLTTRAIAVGLLYLLIWEGVLATFASGARVLSVGQYSLAIANAIAHDSELNAHLGAGHRPGDGHDRDGRHAGPGRPAAGRLLAQGRRGLSRYAGACPPGRNAGPCPGTITEATARMRRRLCSRAAWSAASGSCSGPSGPHQACVHAYTPPGVAASVVMSSAVCPGVAISRTDGVSSKSPGSRLIHRSPR